MWQEIKEKLYKSNKKCIINKFICVNLVIMSIEKLENEVHNKIIKSG